MGFKEFQISTQNPKGLAHRFTEKLHFSAKTDRNSVCLGRNMQILDQLHIIVLYINFYGFKKNQISAQNPKGLVHRFTVKLELVAKTDRNSVFFGRNTYISDQLHIIVPYISFYGF
jgi:hypothetical protein